MLREDLYLADAITYACENKPDLIIDMATLTGASRVAMGTEVPSFFCNNDSIAMELIDSSIKNRRSSLAITFVGKLFKSIKISACRF